MTFQLSSSPFKYFNEICCHLPSEYTESQTQFFNWCLSTPKYSTVRVNTLKSTSDEVISALRQQLDFPEILSHEVLPECILVGSSRPSSGPSPGPDMHVVVDVICGQAVLRGAHIFAPGVIGMPSWVTEGQLVNILVDLHKKCKRGFSKSFDGATACIGVGVVKMNRYKLFDDNVNARGVAVEVVSRVSLVPSFEIPKGLGVLQNLPSMVCSHVLEADASHLVLDMCAAPGNKTSHIAALTDNKSKIIALDKTPNKVNKIKELCSALGITNVTAFVWDSTRAVSNENLMSSEAPPFHPRTFDRILLDAPCTALGQRPMLFNTLTPKQLHSCTALQKQLFRRGKAVQLLKPGGILVYSTCSLSLDENERIIEWALAKYPEIELSPSFPILGGPAAKECRLPQDVKHFVQRFGPPTTDTYLKEKDTIGFFIAKIKKLY